MLTRAEMHGGKIVVAISNEQIVGLASGEIYKRDPDEELEVIDYVNGEVSELYVVRSHRRNGIGRLLLAELDEHFRTAGCGPSISRSSDRIRKHVPSTRISDLRNGTSPCSD